MFFRHLTLFRFPRSLDFSLIAQLLPTCQLRPVGPLELSAQGFISPYGQHHLDEVLYRQHGTTLWLTVGHATKILPSAVITDLVNQQCAQIEATEGHPPSSSRRRRLKEQIFNDLLPKAFVKSTRTDALLDCDLGYLAIDTSRLKEAEAVSVAIRHLLGSFPALPIAAEIAPRSVLTAWLAGDPMPDNLSLGHECELKDPIDRGAIIRCQNFELDCREIRQHLQTGKQVTRLSLTFEDRLSFVLGDDLIFRKLRFLDGALDHIDQFDQGDFQAEMDAQFALMSGELHRLLAFMTPIFQLSQVDHSLFGG